LERYQKTLRK